MQIKLGELRACFMRNYILVKSGLHIVIAIAQRDCDRVLNSVLKLSAYRLQIFLVKYEYLRSLQLLVWEPELKIFHLIAHPSRKGLTFFLTSIILGTILHQLSLPTVVASYPGGNVISIKTYLSNRIFYVRWMYSKFLT